MLLLVQIFSPHRLKRTFKMSGYYKLGQQGCCCFRSLRLRNVKLKALAFSFPLLGCQLLRTWEHLSLKAQLQLSLDPNFNLCLIAEHRTSFPILLNHETAKTGTLFKSRALGSLRTSWTWAIIHLTWMWCLEEVTNLS